MWNCLAKKSVVHLPNDDKCREWENRPFVHHWPQPNTVQGDTNKTKKLKRKRTAFTTMQLKFLEKMFERCKYIDSKLRAKISSFLKISDKTVKVWFQNRRMKEKKESSEASSSSSEVTPSMSHGVNLPHDPLNFLNAPYENHLDMKTEMNVNQVAYNNNNLSVGYHSSHDNRASIYSFESASSENYEVNSVSSIDKPYLDVIPQDICMQTESANTQQSIYTGVLIPKNESVSTLQQAQHVLLDIGQETSNFSAGYNYPNEQYFSPAPENTDTYTNLYNYNNYFDHLYQYPENMDNKLITNYNFN